MHPPTAFPASALSHEQLAGIIVDSMSLQYVRAARRLIARSWGALTILAVAVSRLTHVMTVGTCLMAITIALAAPGAAFAVELRLRLRLSRRLAKVPHSTNPEIRG